MDAKTIKKSAVSFVLLMGIVSLFSDMTHEGARSIYGAYLELVGASAATIGFVTGLGEFLGYSLRLATGFIADKTRKYWLFCILGYVINMVCIPLIALVTESGWKFACVLIIMERVGKAFRQPAKNTLVSFASGQLGTGKTFAIQEFLDQIGAFSGPLLLFVTMLFTKGSSLFTSYRICFAVLIIPAILTILFLLLAKRRYPDPESFETDRHEEKKFSRNRSFILYIVAMSFFAFGFMDFPLITMHIAKESMVKEDFLPLLYSGAMLSDAFAALLWGWLYDKYGVRILIVSTFLGAFFPILIFGFHSMGCMIAGIVLWGIGMGAQESILKSTVTTLVPKANRSTGFGIFETSFGVFWFLGSWVLGLLYDHSVSWMIIVSVISQFAAIPLLWMIKGGSPKESA